MNKTILYIGGFKLPNKNSSAIRAVSIARVFKNLGYQVELGGKGESDTSEYSDINFWNTENYNNVKSKQYRNIDAIEAKIKHIGKNNITAIIAYNYAPLAFFKIYNYCKNNNIKLVQDITEWYEIDGRFTIEKWVRMLLTNWRISVLGPKTINLIVSTSYLKKKLKSSNCLILPQISLNLDSISNEKKILKNDIIKFVYIGSPGQEFSKERVDWCINIFNNLGKKYKNFSFEIAGINIDYFSKYPKLLSKIETSSNKITLKGRLNHQECIDLLENSHFLIFFRPNTRVSKAGYPGKAKEAFDHGIPIITNNTGDIAVYTKNGYNGFVFNSFNELELEYEIEKILNKELEDLNKVIKNCRSKNPFSSDIFNEKIMSFLNNLKTL